MLASTTLELEHICLLIMHTRDTILLILLGIIMSWAYVKYQPHWLKIFVRKGEKVKKTHVHNLFQKQRLAYLC